MFPGHRKPIKLSFRTKDNMLLKQIAQLKCLYDQILDIHFLHFRTQ